MKLKITILLLCLFALSDITMAQETPPPASSETNSSSSNYGLPRKKDFDKWSIGIFGGVNWFQGDLQNSENNSSIWDNLTDPVFGLKIGYQMTHSFQLNVRGNYTKLTGEENDIRMRLPEAKYDQEYSIKNASFETRVIQGTINMNYTLGNISFVQRNKRFHLFGEIGVGIFSFSPKVKGLLLWNNVTPHPDSLLVDRSNITEGLIAGSLGAKYQFGRFDINLMFTYNKTLTDAIDWAHDAKTESDNYTFFTLGLNYTLGKKQAMMEWVNPMEVVYNDMAELKDKMDIISGDKDKDGVSDMFDKDNSTAEGTKVYGDGTMVDTDGDGIPDGKDSDPFSQKGAKVDANGVEVDTDGDGVPDSRDLEPNTPKGSLTNFQGIAIDKALNESGSSSNAVGWLPPIFFDLDKTEVKASQRDRVLIIAKILLNNPNLKLNIIGNCDPSAGENYNQKLGQKRADAVKNHLVKHYGIDEARLSTNSKGEKEQLAKKLNPMNRRVDFEVAK
ncbi:MAG TPA: OmpA family protein [Bacteroidia bacterium]|nr:OmpA family protein [Bacteroidia bacterium]